MSRGTQIFVIIVVDLLCAVGLYAVAFVLSMRAWAGAYVDHPHGGTRDGATAFAVVAVILALFAFFLFRAGAEAGGYSQALLALIAGVVALGGLLPSDTDSQPRNRVPVPSGVRPATPTNPMAGRTFCYSGGICYVDGTPESGAP